MIENFIHAFAAPVEPGEAEQPPAPDKTNVDNIHDCFAPAPDALAAIQADLAAASASFAKLSIFDTRISEANDRREQAKSALHAFSLAEIQRLRAWAETPGDTEAPQRDLTRDAELVAAVEQADREYDAAVSARAHVQPMFSARLAALQKAHARLDAHKASALRDDANAKIEALAAVVADAHTRLVEVLAIRQSMLDHADQLRDQQQPERAAAWHGAASTLQIKLQPLFIQADPVLLASRTAEMRRKIEGGL